MIDPSQDIHEKKDIALRSGKVCEVSDTINASKSVKVVDALDRIVTPGLVDFHVHVFHKIGGLGIDHINK